MPLFEKSGAKTLESAKTRLRAGLGTALVHSPNFICLMGSILSSSDKYLFKPHDHTYRGALLGAHYRQARLNCKKR